MELEHIEKLRLAIFRTAENVWCEILGILCLTCETGYLISYACQPCTHRLQYFHLFGYHFVIEDSLYSAKLKHSRSFLITPFQSL